MFRILTCLTTEHDWRLVVVAGVICLLASLVAVNLYHRARATAGNVRLLWIITAGAATGSGIWATHFIAMLAYDPGGGIAFHTALTVRQAFELECVIMVTHRKPMLAGCLSSVRGKPGCFSISKILVNL